MFFNSRFFIHQAIHDDVFYLEIEQHRIFDGDSIPLSLKKYPTTLASKNVPNLEGKTPPSMAMRDLYGYTTVHEYLEHILECIMDMILF